jgi:hypothetical protein
MKFYLIVLFLSFFSLTISCHSDTSTQQNEKTEKDADEISWEKIRSDKFDFQVMFPVIEGVKLVEQEVIQEDTEFGDVKKTSFNLNCQKIGHINLAYSIIVLEVGKENLKNYSDDDFKKYFSETEATLVELTNSTSILKNVIDKKDYHGREIWFKNEHYGLRIKTRIILRNGFEYRISVMMYEKDYLNPYINNFMNSFEFI